MRILPNKLRSVEGAEIAEAALVLPVVFVFLLGIVWFGRAFNIYSTITQAAQQGAIVAARPTCATCGAPQNGQWQTTDFPGDPTVVNTISGVMQASSLNPSQILPNSIPAPTSFCQSPPNPPSGCTTTSNITICREVLLNSASAGQPPANQPQTCGTFVSFQYPFQFYLPFTSLNLNQVILTAQAQSRIEN